MHSRLIRPVSTRRATQSCIDPAFWAEPFWRPGARHACALEGERCSNQIESQRTRRGPRRLIGLFPAPSANEPTPHARRCGEGLPKSLQPTRERLWSRGHIRHKKTLGRTSRGNRFHTSLNATTNHIATSPLLSRSTGAFSGRNCTLTAFLAYWLRRLRLSVCARRCPAAADRHE